MAIQDSPVQQAPQTMLDFPTPIEGERLNSDQTEQFLAVQASFLDNYLNGSDVVDNYAHYSRMVNKSAEANILANKKASVDAQEVAQDFSENPYGFAGDFQANAMSAGTAVVASKEQAGDVDKQYAEAISGPDVDMQAVEREAAMASMYKVLNEFEEEVSFGDKTMDFFAGFIPGRSTYAGYKVTGDIWDQSEGVTRIIRGFKKQPISVQERVFPVIKEELREKIGDAAAYRVLEGFLDATGGEESDEFSNLDTAADVVDLSGIGLIFGQFAKGARQGYNLTKSMKRVGNEQGAVDSAVASIVDAEIRAATNQDEVTALGNVMPFDISLEDPGYTKGLSGKVVNETKKFFGEVDQTTDDIMLGKGFLKEGIVSTRQRNELEAEVMRRFKAEQAEEMKPIFRDENQTTFSYKILDDEGNITEKEYTMNVTLDDAGMWDQYESGLIANLAGSPNWIARSAKLKEDVSTAQRIDYLTARVNRQLTDLTQKALEPLGNLLRPANKKKLAKVDNALMQGDEWKNSDGTRGTVFNVEQLKTRFKLDDQEISAYYRVNRLYNNIWRIRNHEKRQEMVGLGYKNLNFSRTGEKTYGKPFENATTASGSLRTNNINYVYDTDLDKMIDVKSSGENFFKTAYENDKVIIKLDESYDIGGDRGNARYILSSKDEVSELPQEVLSKKEGYVPRVYKTNVYFAKEMIEKTVDMDKKETVEKTLRFFDNKKEGEAYVQGIIDDELADITDPIARAQLEEQLKVKYQLRSDRESEILAAQSGEVGHGSGGLYTGARAQDDILFGLNGDKAERVNSFEALTRNIGNLSRYTSINQWRLGLEQRWVNTANEMFRKKGIDKRVTQLERLDTIAESVDEIRFLNRMHDQIRDWQNFPTESERFFQTAVQNMYDFAKGRGWNRTAKMLGNLRDKDPVSAARATAFHSLLGWFNPAQFWVQAQGMSIAYSLGLGKYAGRSMANAMALRALGEGATSTGRISAVSKGARFLSAKGAYEAEDLSKLHELWKKTGYQDSVVQTADHAAAAKGYGVTMDAIKRTADKGLIFYRQGELMNRSFSFTIAVERWMEKSGKGIQDITDNALKAIMDDANNMMLNMTRANRASWQKGLPSLPTQFLQVTTKFLETATMANRQFDKSEVGRMLLGQLALYGTAGIPIVGGGVGIAGMLATEIFGMDQQDIDNNPAIVKTINDGFWGLVAYQAFGVDIELSSRGSLLRGVGDFVDNWFIQESTITEKLLGAFGSTQTNFVDSFIRELRPFTIQGASEIDFEDVGSLLVNPVLNSISTWNNAKKAYYMRRMGEIYNRRGRVVARGNYDFLDQLAQAIGFQRTEMAETYDLAALNRADQQGASGVVDDIIITMNAFAAAHPDGDYTQEEFDEHMKGLQLLYGWLDPDQQAEARDSVKRALMEQPRRNYEASRYIQRTMEATVDKLDLWKSTAVGNKIIRVGEPVEE